MLSPIPFAAAALVFAGALILIRALFIVRRLIAKLPAGTLRNRWYTMTVFIALFLLGYATYIAAFWNSHTDSLDLLVPAVFFLGGCFVWLTAILSLQTAMDVLRVSLLEQEAFTDPLTGIFNRRYLDRRLLEEVAMAKRYGLPLSVLMLDIDHFKRVNDQHGHQTGDQVLVKVGEIVTDELRDTDILARYGGEEFVIVAPHTPLAQAADLAERLRRRIEDHVFQLRKESYDNLQAQVTASIGVADFGAQTGSIEKLIQAADERLYRAKNKGRNRVISGADTA